MKAGDELTMAPILALAARLHLERPLVFLDLETTGLNTDEDRIWELGAIKLRPTLETTGFYSRFNPGIPVSEDAKAKTGIRDEDLAGERPFASLARMLHESLTGVDLAAYNGRKFDAKVLIAEFGRAGLTWTPGLIVDPFAIWQRKEPRDLKNAIRRFFPDAADDGGNHEAAGDALGVVRVLAGQIAAFWPDAPGAAIRRFTVKELADAGRDPDWIDEEGKIALRNGVPTFTVGKHAGTPILDLPSGYVAWVLKNDFPADTKRLIADMRSKAGIHP